MVRQNGTEFSSIIISEGTLRVLALCAIIVNPWLGSLIAFDEPENRVHPLRLVLIANLMTSLAIDHRRPVIITTHSSLFCSLVLKKAREYPNEIGLFRVKQIEGDSIIDPFDAYGPLFEDAEISAALSSEEDGLFEQLMLRGVLND